MFLIAILVALFRNLYREMLEMIKNNRGLQRPHVLATEV